MPRLRAATKTRMRANMTAQASRMPQASAFASCGFSWARLAKDNVTAVDEARPRQSRQASSPGLSKYPRQHIADERQARNKNHEQPQLVGIERAPRIDGLVGQERECD